MLVPIGDVTYNLDAVLFDLDGTLVETHIDFPAMKRAMLDLAASIGATDPELERLDALAIVHAAAKTLPEPDVGAFVKRAFAALEDIEVAGSHHPVAIPGAADWCGQLTRSGVRVGVVTRNCRRISEALLAQFSISHDVLLTRDDVGHTKPDPRHLWAALERLACEPSAAMMVGDHWMDIAAGRSAGCQVTMGVLGAREREWFDRRAPDIFVRNFSGFVKG